MLQVRNLRKEFESVVAVDGVSLRVERGSCLASSVRTARGRRRQSDRPQHHPPDGGEILFDGKPFTEQNLEHDRVFARGTRPLSKSRVLNTIAYFGSLKGMEEREAKREAHRWLERFGLVDRSSARIDELSKGNQQKVQFITAVLHRPQLLILDEPFTGFDP